VCWRDKSYTLDSNYYKTLGQQGFDTQSGRRKMVAEPVNPAENGKAHTVKAQYYKNGVANFITNDGFDASAVAEPVRVGTIENDAKNPDHDSQQYRVYSPDAKGVTLCGNGGGLGAKTGLYATPAGMAWRGHATHGNTSSFEMRGDQKANAVIVGHQNRLVIEDAPPCVCQKRRSRATPTSSPGSVSISQWNEARRGGEDE